MANVNVNVFASDGPFSRMSSTYDNLKASLAITEEHFLNCHSLRIVFKIKSLFGSSCFIANRGFHWSQLLSI